METNTGQATSAPRAHSGQTTFRRAGKIIDQDSGGAASSAGGLMTWAVLRLMHGV